MSTMHNHRKGIWRRGLAAVAVWVMAVTMASPALAAICSLGAPSLDVVLVLDTSGSMGSPAVPTDTQTKIEAVKDAAVSFVSQVLSANPKNRIGLVTFSGSSDFVGTNQYTFHTQQVLQSGLTSNGSTLNTAIRGLTTNGMTCIECGINLANQEIAQHGTSTNQKAVVLLTDGLANGFAAAPVFVWNGDSANPGYLSPYDNQVHLASTYTDNNPFNDPRNVEAADDYALTAARKGTADSATDFYAIGVGGDVDGNFLTTLSNGDYYYVSAAAELQNSLTAISTALGGGTVKGTVYNDTNKDGTRQGGEKGVAGIVLQLRNATGDVIATTRTGADGGYSIPGQCNGDYTLVELLPGGYVASTTSSVRFTLSTSHLLQVVDFGTYPLVVSTLSLTATAKTQGADYVATGTSIQSAAGTPWPTGGTDGTAAVVPSVAIAGTYSGPASNDIRYYVWKDCSTVSGDITLTTTQCGVPVIYTGSGKTPTSDSISLDSQVSYLSPGTHYIKVIGQRGAALSSAVLVPVNVIGLSFSLKEAATTMTVGQKPNIKWTTSNATDFTLNGTSQAPNIASNVATPNNDGYTLLPALVSANIGTLKYTAVASNSHGSATANQQVTVVDSGTVPPVNPVVGRFCGGE